MWASRCASTLKAFVFDLFEFEGGFDFKFWRLVSEVNECAGCVVATPVVCVWRALLSMMSDDDVVFGAVMKEANNVVLSFPAAAPASAFRRALPLQLGSPVSALAASPPPVPVARPLWHSSLQHAADALNKMLDDVREKYILPLAGACCVSVCVVVRADAAAQPSTPTSKRCGS